MKSNIYWIDLFAGAGGTSTGIHLASPYTKVLACVNHDANAIKSHAENHPDAHHFTEDVRDFAVVVKSEDAGKVLKITKNLKDFDNKRAFELDNRKGDIFLIEDFEFCVNYPHLEMR